MLALDDGEPLETTPSPCPLSVARILDRQRGDRVIAFHPGIRTPRFTTGSGPGQDPGMIGGAQSHTQRSACQDDAPGWLLAA
jgi:hypothetical protein